MNSRLHQNELESRAFENQQSPTGLRTRISRGLNILKYYRTSQLVRRGVNVLKKRLQRSRVSFSDAPRPFSVSRDPAFRELGQLKCEHAYRQAGAIFKDLENGNVCLLNETHELDWRINQQKTLLWQFQLHYHEFLLPLANKPDAHSLLESTVASWLKENSPESAESHLDAWHPYCISRRIPVWISILEIVPLNSEIRKMMVESLFDQANHLAANLEWDLRGNHLLENVRALTWAACYFESELVHDWIKTIYQIIRVELNEQILPWGEHFERAPMYHCQILGNFLETIFLAQTKFTKLAEELRPVVKKMNAFLESILHSDNEIPLMGDSCFGEAPSAEFLQRMAQLTDTVGTAKGDESPYFIFRNNSDFLLFDRGNAGPDQLPAHAHCDLTTVVASISGHRLLVDSGVHDYEDGSMRAYCRSSIGHNVVTVDDENQFDIWSRFRMGYRGSTSHLEQGEKGDVRWASCRHDGYRRFGIRVERLVGTSPEFWFCIDRVGGGTGQELTGRLHFSPETEIVAKKNNRFQVNIAQRSIDLSILGRCQVKIVPGWHCPEFGKRQPTSVIEYRFAPKQIVAGWLLWVSDTTPPSTSLMTDLQSTELKISNPSNQILYQHNWNLAE